jgi:hypothetical protein
MLLNDAGTRRDLDDAVLGVSASAFPKARLDPLILHTLVFGASARAGYRTRHAADV